MTTTNTLKKDKDVKTLLLKAVQNGQQALSEYESKLVVAAAGVPVTQEVLVHSRQEVIVKVDMIGFTVYLKESSPALKHKTEIGIA